MISIADRLKIIMGRRSGRKFAAELGSSTTTVNQYLNGRMPPADFIELVCERYDVDPGWLLTGRGSMGAGRAVIDQDASNVTNGGDLHIDIHHPPPTTAKERYEQYEDPISQAFLKDWLALSDVVKMRVWTLVKEELARAKG